MRREATLIGVDATGKAVVQLDNVSQCLRCSRGQGCGAGISGSFESSGPRGVQLQARITTRLPLSAGQKVLIDIDEHGSGWLWSVFGAYGLPLTGLLLATGLATALTAPGSGGQADISTELVVVLSALSGLAGGIFAWRALASRVLTCVERSLCLQSARIVAISPSFQREP